MVIGWLVEINPLSMLIPCIPNHLLFTFTEERVSNLADLPTDGSQRCTVTTEKGTTVEADLVCVWHGMKLSTSA